MNRRSGKGRKGGKTFDKAKRIRGNSKEVILGITKNANRRLA